MISEYIDADEKQKKEIWERRLKEAFVLGGFSVVECRGNDVKRGEK